MPISTRLVTTLLALAGLVACGSHERDLAVVSFAPRPTAESPTTPMRIRFDKPVVSDAEVGKPLAAAPVALTPAARVEATWEDRQTLLVRPLDPLRSSTEYTVALTGDLEARAKESRWSFVSVPLEVKGLAGADPGRVPPRPELTLAFNQKVAAADVAAFCHIDEAASGKPTALVASDPALVDDKVRFGVAAPLGQGADYVLVCDGLAGAGGTAGLAGHREKLHTHPVFGVVSFSPLGQEVASDGARLEIQLATPVALEDIAAHVVAEPKVLGLGRGWLDDTHTRYTVEVDLEASTDYAIHVEKGAKDLFGQSLAETASASFHTGAPTPRMSLETGIYAVEPTRKGYPVWTRSMTRFDVACARVPTEALVRVLTSDMNYDPWYDAKTNKPIDWKKLGLAAKATTVKTGEAKAKNKWLLSELVLPEMCAGGSGARGVFLAEMSAKELRPEAGREWRFKPRQRVLANVTDLGLLLKVGPASGLLWATGLHDGKPVAGAHAVLYTPRGKKVFEGDTDANGLLRLPGGAELVPSAKDAVPTAAAEEDFGDTRQQRLIAVVDKDGDTAVVDGDWQNGIQIWNFGVPEDKSGGKTTIRGFIQSDRGIYRPGELVHFKGLVRAIGGAEPPRLPRDKTVAVHVEDARGQAVYEKTVPLSAFGGFAFDLELAESAPLGDYFVVATLGKQSFRESFMVQEFRKVEFELKVGPTSAELGGEVKIAAGAQYLFGAPVVGAKVKWSVERRRHVVDYPAYPDYNFTDIGALGDGYWWGERERNLSFVADGAGKTDAAGNLTFTVTDPETDVVGPQDYLAQVSVTDETDQTVSKQIAVTAHASDFYLGMHANEMVQAVGMPYAVNTVAVDPQGKQVAARATLSMIRQVPECTYQGGVRSYVTCNPKQEKIWSRQVDIPASGTGVERIMPRQPGEYIIRLDAKDGKGRAVTVSDWVWVLGPGEAFWSGDESDRMSVVAGKTKYEPGETARLVPRTSLAGGTMLVTVERNGILDAWVRPMASSGEGVDVKLTAAHAPNVFASIAVVKGRDGEGDKHRPRFQMGVVNLTVAAEAQRLKVEVVTDRREVQPGEPVSGTIRVVGGDGKPVSAEVSLSVADEGVLQLIAYKTPDPMATFYAPWGLGIDSATTWNRVARLADPSAGDPDEGGDGGGGEGPGIRSRFVSSAYWAPALVTDAKGEIAFQFQAPDNLTAFRLMAVAADSGSRFGAGDSRLTIKKPLLVQPVLPRFLAEGDRGEVAVIVRNYTGAAGEARVTAKAEGAKLAATEATVKIDADGSARVAFPAEALPGSRARFTFTAALGKASDGVALEVPVSRPLSVEKMTLGKGKLSEPSISMPLAWDAGAVADASFVDVGVDRTGLSDMTAGLRYLIEYPYGCLEQTLSRFIPMTQVKDLAATLHVEGLEGPKLEGFIKAGVAKVYRFQHEDGQFSLWQAGEPYPHLTVYALYGLGAAQRAGVAVDKTVMKRGLAAVRQWASAPERTLAGARGDGGIMAMAAFVLAELGQPDTALDARLFEARQGLPVYGQAFLLSALALAKAPDAQKKQLEGEILAHLVDTGDALVVKESDPDWQLVHYMSSDARSTAIALSALLRVDPDHAAVEKLVAGLKRQQLPSGRWMNTEDNLFGIVALAEYARKASAGSAKVTVHVGGKTVEKTLNGGEVLAIRTPIAGMTPGALVIEASGPVHYAARLEIAHRVTEAQPDDKGFTVERSYIDPKTEAPLAGYKTGQLVRVRIKVTTKAERHWVALVDPLPAGFEIVNTKLATSVRDRDAGDGGDDSDEGDRWWNPPLWKEIELHDTGATAFADAMDAGESKFDYLARATLAGAFRVAPARVEEMYDPGTNGRSAAGTVQVGR